MPKEKLSKHLSEELRMRYAETSILPFDDNKVLHRFFKDHYTMEEAKTFKIMNDNIIRMSRVLIQALMPSMEGNTTSFDTPLTQYLLDELDIRPTREDLQKIKTKNIKLCVVGLGGAMLNMVYNMLTWSMELSETKLFDKVVVFEKDSIDFSNIPRMGKPIVFNYSPDYSKPFDAEVPGIKTMQKLLLLSNEKELSKERNLIVFSRWLTAEYAENMAKKDYVFVGAPTLETREILSDKKFFFMGHSDFEVDITYSPQNISSLAVETYGTIDIPVLLVNLQLATAAFIKMLASDDEYNVDQRLLDFDMKKWVDENPEKLKELYNV